MTRERFEQVKAAANAMAGEIEWADHPTLGPETFRGIWATVVQHHAFQVAVRDVLELVFLTIEPLFEHVRGHQEVELEAAGLVQSAMKQVVKVLLPEGNAMWAQPLRVKFRNLPLPVMQAPANVFVPSIAEQLGAAEPTN